MKTYAEKRGRKPFDWHAFLNKGLYTYEEIRRAKFLASEWVKCACGNQCAIIPRRGKEAGIFQGEPFDKQLADLGLRFNNEIGSLLRYASSMHPDKVSPDTSDAKETLREIEERSAHLVRGILDAEAAYRKALDLMGRKFLKKQNRNTIMRVATEKIEAGWSVFDTARYLCCCEELNPKLSENAALQRMRVLELKYKK